MTIPNIDDLPGDNDDEKMAFAMRTRTDCRIDRRLDLTETILVASGMTLRPDGLSFRALEEYARVGTK